MSDDPAVEIDEEESEPIAIVRESEEPIAIVRDEQTLIVVRDEPVVRVTRRVT